MNIELFHYRLPPESTNADQNTSPKRVHSSTRDSHSGSTMQKTPLIAAHMLKATQRGSITNVRFGFRTTYIVHATQKV